MALLFLGFHRILLGKMGYFYFIGTPSYHKQIVLFNELFTSYAPCCFMPFVIRFHTSRYLSVGSAAGSIYPLDLWVYHMKIRISRKTKKHMESI